MVLVTNKFQGSNVLSTWSSPTSTRGLILKRPVTTLHFVEKRDKHLRLKQKCCYSLGSHCNGGTQNNEAERNEGGKKVQNNLVKLSYCSDDDENNVSSSPKAQNTSFSYTSETEDSITGQPAIHKLFNGWLRRLHTQSPIQVIDEALGGEEQVPQTTKPETESEIKKTESLQSTKNTVLSWFWILDASIKVPLLLFVPAFVAVNAIYGTEVTKELSPMWVAGPLIVALYIKTFQGLCTLYAFCFNQTIKMIRKLPSYYLVAYHYIAHGKHRDDVKAQVFRPVVAIMNTDYKELTRTKLKQFQEGIVEKCLDFVESVWPYYWHCRTIRFLKRANLI